MSGNQGVATTLDALGLLTSIWESGGSGESYVLDAAGNATRAVRGANGQDTTFITYDALNRPTQRITSAGQVASPQCHPLVQSVAPG
jgi:hypothetical protein